MEFSEGKNKKSKEEILNPKTKTLGKFLPISKENSTAGHKVASNSNFKRSFCLNTWIMLCYPAHTHKCQYFTTSFTPF